MAHEDWLERADFYALGALDPDESRRLEAHLAAGCPACEARVRETREALVLLPRSLPALAPPPAVKTRLLAEVARERRPAPTPGPAAATGRARPVPWFGWAGWGLAVAVAALLLTVNLRLAGTRDELGRLEGRLAALEGELAQRRAELAEHEATLRLLADPEVRYVTLAGLPASPKASAWLLWHPGTRRGLLLVRDLPRPPAGRAYELWALAGPEPVPAGVFTVGESGRGFLRLPRIDDSRIFDRFAVTLEPEGGVPRPTGPMHLLGSL